MEHLVLDEARELVDDTKVAWKVVHYVMDGVDAESTKMTCGGTVDVLIEKVMPEQKALFECYVKCRQEQLNVQEVIFMPEAPQEPTVHIIMDTCCDRQALYGGQKIPLVEQTIPNLQEILFNSATKREKVYIEHLFVTPILPRPVIYLYGAGTCGISLCTAAPLGGFDIFVFDDRKDQIDRLLKETTNDDVHWEATGTNGDEILGVGKQLIEKNPGDAYVVIMTRGHRCDLEVLREVMKLRVQPHYVGMIGSRHKIGVVYDKLEKEGVPRARLEAVHAPIGLPTGGDTPGEIAISVMAELILSRTGGHKGRFPGLHE